MTSEKEKALAIVASVTASLKNGVKHFNKAGKLLRTTEEVIDTIFAEGSIIMNSADYLEVTTPDAEMRQLIQKQN